MKFNVGDKVFIRKHTKKKKCIHLGGLGGKNILKMELARLLMLVHRQVDPVTVSNIRTKKVQA